METVILDVFRHSVLVCSDNGYDADDDDDQDDDDVDGDDVDVICLQRIDISFLRRRGKQILQYVPHI